MSCVSFIYLALACPHPYSFSLQQLRIQGHNNGADTHEHRTYGGAEDKPGVEHPGSQRNGDDVVARGPQQVLDNFALRCLAKFNQSSSVGGAAVDQDDVGGFGG
jgi:hypothetical protein